MSDCTEFSISEMVQGLEQKKFSSLELTESFLKKIELAKTLNCFLLSGGDAAREEAKQADARRAKGEKAALLGVPVAIKDVILTRGMRTTCASRMLEKFIPPYDATVVSKLKQAGTINLGKTNMDEFAMGSSNENSAFGPVKNPWDLERVPGGSSGGSAAAVAARIAPAALGTDTGGSIRQPASLCNIVGIKPTYGRVSRYGVIAFASSLDQVGTFAGNVRDCALVTNAICGKDAKDSTSVDKEVPDFTLNLAKGVKGLRIGIPDEYFIKGLNPEVEKSVRTAVDKLVSLGAEAVRISLPHTDAALSVYYIIAPAEASSNLSRYDGIRFGHRAEKTKDLFDLYSSSRAEGFGAEVKRRIMIGSYVLSAGYFDAYYLHAQKVRALIAKDFHDAFAQQCDVIACPASPTTAFKIGEKSSDPLEMYLSDVFTIPASLAGLPGMTIPCGFDGKGLPIGLQLLGKPWDEETLFRTAGAYEAATDWHTRRPTTDYLS